MYSECQPSPLGIALTLIILFAWGAGKVPGTHGTIVSRDLASHFRDPPAPSGFPVQLCRDTCRAHGAAPRARMYGTTSLMSRTDTLWQGLVRTFGSSADQAGALEEPH